MKHTLNFLLHVRMTWDDDVITPKMLLEHMQGMKYDLQLQMQKGFSAIEKRLDAIDLRLDRLEARVDALEKRLCNVELSIESLRGSRLHHGKSIGDIKTQKLPERVRRIERKLGMKAVVK